MGRRQRARGAACAVAARPGRRGRSARARTPRRRVRWRPLPVGAGCRALRGSRTPARTACRSLCAAPAAAAAAGDLGRGRAARAPAAGHAAAGAARSVGAVGMREAMPGLHGFAAGLEWLLSRRRPGSPLLEGGEAAAAADGAVVGHPACAKVVFSLRAGSLPRLRQRAGAGTKLGLRRADVGTGRGWDPGAACGPFTDDGATGVTGGSRSRRGDGPTGVAMERCRGRGGGPVPVATVGNSQRGFTLIEVLLATTLLALGLALAFATLRAATATVERGEVIAARSERMRAVDGFLRRRLAQATPIAFAI